MARDETLTVRIEAQMDPKLSRYFELFGWSIKIHAQAFAIDPPSREFPRGMRFPLLGSSHRDKSPAGVQLSLVLRCDRCGYHVMYSSEPTSDVSLAAIMADVEEHECPKAAES